MEIVIIFFISVTLLNFTMVGAMDNQISNTPRRRDIRASSNPDNYHVRIQKLINDHEAIDDVVVGTLYPFTIDHPPVDDDAYGHVTVLLNRDTKFYAFLRRIDEYQYYGYDQHRNSQRTTYRCTIKRGIYVFLEKTLSRYTGNTNLEGVARVDFINHNGVYFVGELIVSKPSIPVKLLPLKKRKDIGPSGAGSSSTETVVLD